MNRGLDNFIGRKANVRFCRSQKLRWADLVKEMPNGRTQKVMAKWKSPIEVPSRRRGGLTSWKMTRAEWEGSGTLEIWQETRNAENARGRIKILSCMNEKVLLFVFIFQINKI